MSTITVDVERLSDDTYAAEFMFDNQHAPEEAMDALYEGMRDYGIGHGIGEDDLFPDSICGPVAALTALGLLICAAYATDPLSAAYMVSEAGGRAAHAMDHGDRIALAVFSECDSPGVTIGDVLKRAEEWILAHLPTSDPDAFLALLSAVPEEGTDAA